MAAIGLLALLAHGRAGAQEFEVPSLAAVGPGDFVERGLPPERGELGIATHFVNRPLGLTTRALLAAAALRGARLGLAVARTGDETLGSPRAARARASAQPSAATTTRRPGRSGWAARSAGVRGSGCRRRASGSPRPRCGGADSHRR
jgi:hypothetical protein